MIKCHVSVMHDKLSIKRYHYYCFVFLKRYTIHKPKMKAFRRVTQNVQLENGTLPIFCIRRYRIFECFFSSVEVDFGYLISHLLS